MSEGGGSALLRFLRATGAAFARCGGNMRRSLLIQGTTISAVAVMLLLCGVVRVLAGNTGRLVDRLGRDVAMVIYLEESATPARVTQIGEALGRLPGVSYVRPVTRREAHQRLRRSLGDRGDLLDGVEEGLLPASIEVGFRSGVSDILRVHPIYEQLRRTPGVQDVELMGDWVRRLVQAQRFIDSLGLTLGALVALCCLYVVWCTMRVGVYARRDEIEVLRLLGATNLHVALPLLLEGILQGLLGAALGLLLLYGLYELAEPQVMAIGKELLGEVRLSFLPESEVWAALGIGGLVGLCGSHLAVHRHLRG